MKLCALVDNFQIMARYLGGDCNRIAFYAIARDCNSMLNLLFFVSLVLHNRITLLHLLLASFVTVYKSNQNNRPDYFVSSLL
jgi:hypothetical protein